MDGRLPTLALTIKACFDKACINQSVLQRMSGIRRFCWKTPPSSDSDQFCGTSSRKMVMWQTIFARSLFARTAFQLFAPNFGLKTFSTKSALRVDNPILAARCTTVQDRLLRPLFTRRSIKTT